MKKNLQVILFLILVQHVSAQVVYKDVAGIFYSRCTSCHHTNASDYPFMNYTETSMMAPLIQNALSTGKMPPWYADTSYTRFQHERIITSSEKQTILNWVSGGALKGDTTQAPAAPVYSTQFQLQGNADLTLSIGTFTSTSSGIDKYFCFAIPSGLTQDRIIRAFEVVPGNKAIVHHAVITADTTGNFQSDLSGGCYNVPGNLGIGTYAPGQKAAVFPGQAPLMAGIYLKAGSKIIIQLHYPAGSAGQVDSTKLRLYFYPVGTTGVRRIYSTTPLQNWNMVIPPNTVKPYWAFYPSLGVGIPAAISAFAVMPHSHLLCKSILYYALNPGVDTIPLVRINDWNFEWQDYYTFKKLVKIPAGYRLYSKHVYDNTVNNPNNPNSPPITVYSNTGTKDEMLFDGMMYMNYQQGDELIDIESIINSDPLLSLSVKSVGDNVIGGCTAFPNPFTNGISLRYRLNQVAAVKIQITDVSGRKIINADLGKQANGMNTWDWDGRDVRKNNVSPGIYFYKISAGDFSYKGKILKQD